VSLRTVGGVRWLSCQPCRRVHPVNARCLFDYERDGAAVSFPCFWAWDYAGGAPYLVLQAAIDDGALRVAADEMRRRRSASA